ncbi:MAG: hypothetical protein PHI71_15340 [Acidiphilium sp.]|nr:hypothetical protein [Acidiphilium sp.]
MAVGVIGDDGTPLVNSRDVAEVFEKRHDHVMQSIGALLEPTQDFGSANKSMGYDVAEVFEKEHKKVIRDIEALIETDEDFRSSNNSMGYRPTQFCVH